LLKVIAILFHRVIGIGNTFFGLVLVLNIAILFTSIVNNPADNKLVLDDLRKWYTCTRHIKLALVGQQEEQAHSTCCHPNPKNSQNFTLGITSNLT